MERVLDDRPLDQRILFPINSVEKVKSKIMCFVLREMFKDMLH